MNPGRIDDIQKAQTTENVDFAPNLLVHTFLISMDGLGPGHG